MGFEHYPGEGCLGSMGTLQAEGLSLLVSNQSLKCPAEDSQGWGGAPFFACWQVPESTYRDIAILFTFETA